jgi:asparagine synthase (glutamine-hydrolysing)
MCGIAGFWRLAADETRHILEEYVQRMTNTIIHRGPDDFGIWTDAAEGVALGFRRLAILDLSPNGHQPMFSADGRWVAIFNGEIFNYRELRKELEQAGQSFRSVTDTEVILEGCSIWGPEVTIPRLWGMFAIVLWDRQEHCLILARDRLGKKPLYYGQMNGVFFFGSELKALRAHPAFQTDIDRDALVSYFRFGYITAPKSIYNGVYKLPPGYYAVIMAGKTPCLRCYWNPKQIADAGRIGRLALSDIDAIDTLDYLLRDAVARRMIADVPLGALLSGGIDSSVVVAMMQGQSASAVKTFSIGFHDSSYNEANWAKKVAHCLGTDHTELYVTPGEAQAVIPHLPDLYDEPFADSSQIPTFLVCELARRHVTVSLSGDGGDELFSGYRRYHQAETTWALLKLFLPSGRRVIAESLKYLLPKHRCHAGDRLYSLTGWMSVKNQTELYRRFISLWHEPESVVVNGREQGKSFPDLSMPESLSSLTEFMMYIDLITYLPDDILVKLDRASMRASLEGRCPILDHRIVELAWSLPLKFKVRDGQRKWLLRQVLYRYVPPNLIDRPKMGFGVPIDAWLRGPLREWAEALLDERRLRQDGYLHPGPIRQAWGAHLSGQRDAQHRLWTVLMFQAWRERWLSL